MAEKVVLKMDKKTREFEQCPACLCWVPMDKGSIGACLCGSRRTERGPKK